MNRMIRRLGLLTLSAGVLLVNGPNPRGAAHAQTAEHSSAPRSGENAPDSTDFKSVRRSRWSIVCLIRNEFYHSPRCVDLIRELPAFHFDAICLTVVDGRPKLYSF